MKQIYLIVLLISSALFSFGQSIRPFKAFDIGGGVNVNTLNGDTETTTPSQSYSIHLAYNPDLYINFIAEFQTGQFKGGSVQNPTSRKFSSAFNSFSLRGQYQVGRLLFESDSRIINSFRNFYAGAGIGVVDIDIKPEDIRRSSVNYPEFYTGGVNQSLSLFLPLRMGYEIKLKNKFKETLAKVDLAYQYNVGLSDDLDGFRSGEFNDNFSQIVLGIKICSFMRQWNHSY